MCAGGVIAYEMASQLVHRGESVELVLLMDAATPQAHYRPRLIASHRLGRLSRLIEAQRSAKLPLAERTWHLSSGVAKKIWNMISWEATSRFTKWSVRARFRLLKIVLSRGRPWPRSVPGLSVREIYECAEGAYVPKRIVGPSTVLIRAKTGELGDTPYIELYSDYTLGWGSVVADLTIVDVDGGHYSMLQEPHVTHLATALQTLLLSQPADNPVHPAINEPAC